MGFDAIEWRGGTEGHVDPTWSPRQRRDLRRQMTDRGVRALCVTAYTSFVSPNLRDRTRSVEDLVRHIELASDLGAPFVRAFAGVREDDAPEQDLYLRVVSELAGVVDFAVEAGVVIAIEQHDDFDRATQIGAILDLLDHPGLGAVWDVANGWAAGESPHVGLEAIRGRICYAQLKDGSGPREDWWPTSFGSGDVPLAAAIRELHSTGKPVPISIEWLRAWSADLAPPEIGLPESLRYVQSLLAAASNAVES
jgi:sugar phosphate isomerase/epimerase